MEDIAKLIKTIEQNLFLPKQLYSCEFNPTLGHYVYGIGYSIIEDCSILSCGCCIAESLYYDIIKVTKNELIHCPVCKSKNVSVIGPVKPLRSLYSQIQSFKDDSEGENSDLTDGITPTDRNLSVKDIKHHEETQQPISKIMDISTQSVKTTNEAIPFPLVQSKTSSQQRDIPHSKDIQRNQTNLLNLFFKIATKVNSTEGDNPEYNLESTSGVNTSENSPPNVFLQKANTNSQEKKYDFVSELVSLTNKSNTIATERLSQESNNGQYKVMKNNTNNMKPLVSPNFDEKKEYYFANCFPIYRKRYTFKTHSKFLKTKSKLFINTAISPNCFKFALISKHKWEVYSIPSDLNKSSPSLLFCGRNTGEYGKTFDTLNPFDPSILMNTDNKVTIGEYVYCKLSDDLLIISDTKNSIQIFDLNQDGKMIHYYCSKYYVRCIDIDPSGKIVACGIAGKDRKTNVEQALITLHRIDRNKMTSQYEFLSPITIALPYRDPINTIQLSMDGLYLSCSTTMESRFLIISLRNVNEPRLIMKSLRSIDTSLESEGITDTKLFPGNSNLMCVTSTAFNSPPIIINTKIEDISNLRSVAQPSLLNKFSDLGSKIHRCEISPRNDSIAFLDKNGSVYLVCAPNMIDNEKRRTVIVEMVADAYRAHESASMKFSSDGHVLYILDRKGVLYVEDFAYDLPQHSEITRCKEIS